MHRTQNSDLAQLIRTGGSLSRVLVDFPTDGVEWTVPGPRLRSITRSLEDAGAPARDVATLTAALEQRSAERVPTPRVLLVHDGELVLDEDLPGVAPRSNEVSFDRLPSLLALLEQRQRAVPYLVLEASAGGGRIRTFLASDPRESTEDEVAGETEHLHEARGGGLSHIGHARHTEEVWKRNETELADVINDIVERHDVELLVVTGDPHVVDLVGSGLSSRARSIVTTLASDTFADGASRDELNALVSARLRAIVDARQAAAIDRASQVGADGSVPDQSLDAVVDALQQADVQTLVLDPDALGSVSLASLAGAPWVAAPGAETYGAASLGVGPAAEALARAAVVTGAEVIFVEADTLPGGVGAAVLRR
jgi:hypothetical protein